LKVWLFEFVSFLGFFFAVKLGVSE